MYIQRIDYPTTHVGYTKNQKKEKFSVTPEVRTDEEREKGRENERERRRESGGGKDIG